MKLSMLDQLKIKKNYLQEKLLNLKQTYGKRLADTFFMHLTLRDHIMIIKQLATLMRAGIPLLNSLAIIQEQSRARAVKHIIEQARRDIENGQYLSNALAKFKRNFGELTINIIAVGEISGNLCRNLDHLAISLKKRQVLRRKIISASVYPMFIIVATVVISILLTTLVFPKIIPVFLSINYQLPWTTRFLIFLNTTVKKYGIFIGLAFVAVIIGGAVVLKIKKVRFWYDRSLITIPLVALLVRTYNIATICRTLGLLLGSGTTIVNAFRITARATANLAYKKELNGIGDQLAKGEKISNQVRNNAFFGSMVAPMIAVGESTRKLSETFMYLADIHEQELDEATQTISTSIEPLLLIFMGLLVGFIAISIITPMYGITQHLTPR